MGCLQHHAGAAGIQFLHHQIGDLLRHPLLHLRPFRDDLHDAGQLAQADDLAVRDIGDVGLAEERQQMVFAHAFEVDVLHEDHFVVFFDEGLAEDLGGVLMQSREQFLIHAGDAIRRFEQPVPFRVFSHGNEDLANRCGNASLVHRTMLAVDSRRSTFDFFRHGRDPRQGEASCRQRNPREGSPRVVLHEVYSLMIGDVNRSSVSGEEW